MSDFIKDAALQENETSLKEETAAEQEAVSYPPPTINIMVSADKLLAYLRVVPSHKGQNISKEEILSSLESRGIVYGIDHAEIEAFCAGDNILKEIKAAKGLAPQKGKDGFVTFHFRTQITNRPIERPDGTVDYKNLDIIQNVSKGDLLCTISPPEEGIDGVNVFGESIKAPMGITPVVPIGNSLRLSEDSLQIFADSDGGIVYDRGRITINELYNVRNDVSLATGNINYNGSVAIGGSVMEGFEVTAQQDITIKGHVEGANLTAGRNILVRDGINGMGRSVIFAEGDISSSFIQNARIKCGGTLYADVVLNSTVEAGNSIVLRGKKGAMIGGSFRAGEVINAKSIGNDMNISQDVIIDPCFYMYEKQGITERPEDPGITKERLISQRNILNNQLDKISAESGKLNRDDDYKDISMAEEKSRLMREILIKKSKVLSAVAEINHGLEEIEAFLTGHDFKIICTGEMHPGTRLTIGSAKMRVNQLIQNQKFYVSEGEIVAGQVLPHEK